MKTHKTKMIPPILSLRWRLTKYLLKMAFSMFIGTLPLNAELRGLTLTYIIKLKVAKKSKKISL